MLSGGYFEKKYNLGAECDDFKRRGRCSCEIQLFFLVKIDVDLVAPHFLGDGKVPTLTSLARFSSIAGQPKHAGDVRKCAIWLAGYLKRIGLAHVRLFPTPGPPIVYGDWLHAQGRPTVLIYGHYDVVPAEPLTEWQSPPFSPEVRGPYLYGRGVADDKGQLFVHLTAIESCLRRYGQLPVNVKVLIEGEEEIGSPHLGAFLARHRDTLKADVALVSDMTMAGEGRPAVPYAIRGMQSASIEITGARHDLHSGSFGGVLSNPLEVLAGIVARLHDANGRIAIPGFYDRVRARSAAERAFMAGNGPADAELLQTAEAAAGWGEAGYSLYERATIRPALTVNGIVGGHQGPGPKAVLPARAAAKLDIRLVPDQRPEEIARLLTAHVARITPPGVRTRVRIGPSARPVVVDRNHPAVQAAARAYAKGFGVRPVYRRIGGSIPVIAMLKDGLGIPVVMMGFAAPSSRIHAPNERLYLPDFFKGVATSMHFMQEIAAVLPARAAAHAA